MRRLRALPFLAALSGLVLLAGCGSSGAGAGASDQLPVAHGDHPASTDPGMSPGMDMGAHGAGPRPSETARMVCADEIHRDVGQLFEDTALDAGTSTWSGRLFSCTYQLPGGPLVLSVKDTASASSGQAYFNALRAFDGNPPLLRGLAAFGLPSYETANGRVVFLKDGKTLAVDAGKLPSVAGPKGESRTDVAYAVAADVIGCWSE